MSPLLGEDSAVSNGIFQYVAGGEAAAIVGMGVFILWLVKELFSRNDTMTTRLVENTSVTKEQTEALRALGDDIKVLTATVGACQK